MSSTCSVYYIQLAGQCYGTEHKQYMVWYCIVYGSMRYVCVERMRILYMYLPLNNCFGFVHTER